MLQLEAENGTLKNTIETERQESKILMEKVELEVAERKLSFHNQQEEMHQLQGKLEQASQAQAELETQYSALEQRHRAEMEEKDAYILSLQKTEQELQSACDALKEENSELLREKSEQAAESARAIEQLEGQCLVAFEATSLVPDWIVLPIYRALLVDTKGASYGQACSPSLSSHSLLNVIITALKTGVLCSVPE